MNSFGRKANLNDLEAIWDIIEKHKASQSTENKASQNGEVKTSGKKPVEENYDSIFYYLHYALNAYSYV